MGKNKIEGVPVLNGEYPIDETTLTNRDFHTIKKVSGLRAAELEEAFAAGDVDLVVALAVCALYRAGKREPEIVDMLFDAEAGKISWVGEDETRPPAPTAVAAGNGSAEPSGTSGEASSLTGGRPVSSRSPTGTEPSEVSAE
jgi:hypothetical protein